MSDSVTTPGPAPDQGSKRRLRPGHIVLLVALVLILIAIIQNLNKVQISFLAWDLDVWLWLLVLVSAALGFVVGWFTHVQRVRSIRKGR